MVELPLGRVGSIPNAAPFLKKKKKSLSLRKWRWHSSNNLGVIFAKTGLLSGITNNVMFSSAQL